MWKWPACWPAVSKYFSCYLTLFIAHCSLRDQTSYLIEPMSPSSVTYNVKQFPFPLIKMWLNIEYEAILANITALQIQCLNIESVNL